MDHLPGVGKMIVYHFVDANKKVDSLKFMCSVYVHIGYGRFV